MSEGKAVSSSGSGLVSLARLDGVWDLVREVRHGDGTVDRMVGTCRFTSTDAGFLQEEDGILETAQGRFHATRRYYWAEAGDVAQVFFEDMRPFLEFPLASPKPRAVHRCDPDRYEAVFDFTLWPDWTAEWTVTGPRKRYVMSSVLSRVAS